MSADYAKMGMQSARAFARSYGVRDKAEIAAIALQFTYDLRKNAELRELAQ